MPFFLFFETKSTYFWKKVNFTWINNIRSYVYHRVLTYYYVYVQNHQEVRYLASFPSFTNTCLKTSFGIYGPLGSVLPKNHLCRIKSTFFSTPTFFPISVEWYRRYRNCILVVLLKILKAGKCPSYSELGALKCKLFQHFNIIWRFDKIRKKSPLKYAKNQFFVALSPKILTPKNNPSKICILPSITSP